MPLYVQNAAWVTQSAHGGDAARFCFAVEQQLHTTATAQEVILAETFKRLSAEAMAAAAVLGLVDVPLTSDEASAFSWDGDR
jgi:hypothetical protein